jgi:hypothetical protein
VISLVDADSFWVDGYFEETNLAPIQVGDPASIKLMGNSQIVRGHVGSIARGINVANAQPNGQVLATVNPIFTDGQRDAIEPPADSCNQSDEAPIWRKARVGRARSLQEQPDRVVFQQVLEICCRHGQRRHRVDPFA